MSKELRIVFYGTPDFAVVALDAIIQKGFRVEAVVTAPDKAAGRGLKLQESPVKKYATTHGLRVLQPEKLKNQEFIATLKEINPDLQVVVAFRMLPEVVWNLPPLGSYNIHASLLPKYRGAAPINWAIMNGESETGVTIFKLKHEIDTGDILVQEKTEIHPTMNAGELHDILAILGAKLITQVLDDISNDKIKSIPQVDSEVTHAPKLFSSNCIIDFNNKAEDVYNKVRGLSPYPTAFTTLKEKKLKVFESKYELDSTIQISVGAYETDHATFLRIACTNGWLYLLDVQLEGKKRMDINSFLRGANWL